MQQEYFDQLMQALLHQQQVWEQLQPAVPTLESAAQVEEQETAHLPSVEPTRSATGAFQRRRLTPLPPRSAHQQEPSSQDAKATLQRELTESFLLD
jgi:hypothetical protein